MLIILDIDETLIHTFSDKLNQNPDLEHLPNFILEDKQYFVKLRPYVNDFLKYVFDNFEVAIWSAASLDYIEEIIKILGYNLTDFKFVYSKNNCTITYDYNLMEYVLCKKLHKISKRYNLEQVLIIDDLAQTAKFNYGNLINIKTYTTSNTDTELLKLISYLHTLKNKTNVRKIEKRNWDINF